MAFKRIGITRKKTLRYTQSQNSDTAGVKKDSESILISGYIQNKLIAPVLFEGSCTTGLFNIWLKQELLPMLPDGALIVLDNATFHRSDSSRDIVRKTGCELLFLPPYSPHLNPIEKLWANIKQLWRKLYHLSLDDLLKSSICLHE